VRTAVKTSVAALPVLAVSVLAFAGCSSEKAVDGDELEEQMTSQLADQVGQTPKSVDCPDDLPAEEGATVECTLITPDDVEFGVTVEATSVDGDNVEFHFQVDTEPKS
jgi:Domain of unknown function (DUF4333)